MTSSPYFVHIDCLRKLAGNLLVIFWPAAHNLDLLVNPQSSIMVASSNIRLPVENKDFTNATVVIIGAGISGMLSPPRQINFTDASSRDVHGDRFDQTK